MVIDHLDWFGNTSFLEGGLLYDICTEDLDFIVSKIVENVRDMNVPPNPNPEWSYKNNQVQGD